MSNNIKVGFSATDAGYTSTVKKINESTKTIDDNVKKVSGSVTSSFASMVKAGAGLAVGFGAIKAAGALVREVFQGFGEALDLGGQLKDLSDRTGESAGNLMLLQRAFQNAGSSAEAVGPAINKLQKFMVDAANGSEKNNEALSRLGLTFKDLEGKAPIDQMQILAERIQQIPEPAERSAAAMSIFGKSGGQLLPVLMNLSGELETAKGQLGSMPDIMTRFSKVFDDVSDNIEIIKGKFMEFAAGLLSKVAPALEFITTVMTQFDAAAFGERIGQALIGAGQGMQAFKSAMDALALGEFKLAMEIAFNAMRLSAAESFNSIVKHAQASFSAVAEFLKAVLGPGSGLYTIITGTFETLGMKFSRSVGEGLKTILEVIPGWGSIMAARIAESIDVLDMSIANKSSQMKNALAQVPADLVYGFNEAGKAFDKTLSGSKDFINTQEIIAENQKLLAQLEEKKAASIREQGLEAEKYDYKRITRQEQYQKTLKVIADLEAQIKEAKMLGDDTKVKQLERQLALEKLIAEEIKNGKTYQDALAIATEKQNNADANILANKKGQTAEMQKQLSLSEQMQEDLDKRVAEEQVDPGGRTAAKFQSAMDEGNFKKAQREIDKLAKQEKESSARNLFGEFKREQEFVDQENFGVDFKEAQKEANKELRRAMKMSPVDIAKELGIETGGKKRSELIDAIEQELEKRKEKDKPGKEGEREPAKPADGKDSKTGVLESILTEVKGIGKKLPVSALGY